MRYDSIKKKKWEQAIANAVQIWESEEKKYCERILSGKRQQVSREWIIGYCVGNAVAQHLEVLSIDDFEFHVNTGVDRSLEYFLGDWWTKNETDRTYLDKNHPQRTLIWSAPYLNAAFLCGLSDRWEDLRRISDWVDETVCPEMTFGAIEDEFMLFLIYVASTLRTSPLSTHDRLRQAIEQGRPRRPKLLLAAFQAAIDSNQRAFDKAILESVKNCEKQEVEDVPNFSYWVGVPQSFVVAVAEKRNLKVPHLPPNLDALLVRRSTLGL
jgi:hypothetical protein